MKIFYEMNVDDYDIHILQKYRLAIAVAIIRNTPEDSNPSTYLEGLRKKITSEMDSVNPDMNVCDDDFNFDDDETYMIDKENNGIKNLNVNKESSCIDSQREFNDSMTILKDFDINQVVNNINNDEDPAVLGKNSMSDVMRTMKGNDNEEIPGVEIACADVFSSQSTYYESSQSQHVQTTVPVNNIGEKYKPVRKDTVEDKPINNYKYHNRNQINNTEKCSGNTQDATYYDSQKTILYSLHGFTEDYTHVSQSQDDHIVLPRYLLEKGRTKENSNATNNLLKPENHTISNRNLNPICTKNIDMSANLDTGIKVKTSQKSIKRNGNRKKRQTDKRNAIQTDLPTVNDDKKKFTEPNVANSDLLIVKNTKNIYKERNIAQTQLVRENHNTEHNIKSNIARNVSTINIDKNYNNEPNLPRPTFKTVNDDYIPPKSAPKSNIHHNTEPYMSRTSLPKVNDIKKHKYETESNIEDIKSKRSRILNNDNNSDLDHAYLNEIKSQFININSNINLNFDTSNAGSTETEEVNSRLDENMVQDSLFVMNTERPPDTYIDISSQNTVKSNIDKNLHYDSQIFPQFSQELESEILGNVQNEKANEVIQRNHTERIEEDTNEVLMEDLFDELTDSQTEAVPFKVLEELNKVKTFLNKCMGRSSDSATDSGYKTDSQTRSYFKSALQSSSALNQSAYCILGFITRCPLADCTADIADEISRNLGQLIDRLHEEERYPSFLEHILETVQCLLAKIHEEDSAEHKLLDKEEAIHRLFLLNKSPHIIQYTIQKIIHILEDVHSRLNQEELLELTHTIKTENLSYIFHVLETLIKRLLVSKSYSSQKSSQNSQEDVIKKSSITDIWRKKWNGGKPELPKPNSGTKQCVLVQCREILNNIIVKAIDGYSLISYSALQCFNLLQN